MAFKVLASIADPGDKLFYTQAFREHLEAHLNVLRFTNPRRIDVPPELVYQFEGNLFGLLASKGEPHDQHYIIMRMNDFHNSFEFGRKDLERAAPINGVVLLAPDTNLLARIRTLYLSKQK
jgi:hypothetical protein